MNTLALKAAADEFYRGTQLDGNAGRTVRRILEQRLLTVVDGSASACLPVDTNARGMPFAYIVDRLRQRMLSLESELAELPGPTVSFSVTSIEPAKGSFGVKLDVSNIPTSMRERQDLLAKMHTGLYCVMKNLDQEPLSPREIMGRLFGEDMSANGERHSRYAEQFQAILDNKFDELGRTPVVLCALAGILNPAVIEADAHLEASYAALDTTTAATPQQ